MLPQTSSITPIAPKLRLLFPFRYSIQGHSTKISNTIYIFKIHLRNTIVSITFMPSLTLIQRKNELIFGILKQILSLLSKCDGVCNNLMLNDSNKHLFYGIECCNHYNIKLYHVVIIITDLDSINRECVISIFIQIFTPLV